MKEFRTFSDFVTDNIIIDILARERGKYAQKNSRRKESPAPMYVDELKPMMPPRKIWVNPGRAFRPSKPAGGLHGLGRWTYSRRLATARVKRTILKYRGEGADAPWLERLNAFIGRIHRIARGEVGDFKMETPSIHRMFKEYDGEKYVYRPISVYSSLETKVVIALVYRYLLTYFDCFFHKDMYFSRAPRRQSDGRCQVPNYLDAVRAVIAYRRKHDRENIYVGECDIQKFYDIFNHDDVMVCFDDLFAAAVAKYEVGPDTFSPVRKLVKAYLDSFDYYRDVMSLNENPDYWREERARWRTEEDHDPKCGFKWVSDKAFIGSGCYDAESLERAKRGGKLGIPQGGALSGMIVNVVMRCVDGCFLGESDPDRLFVRYCDDIMLMHTVEEKCETYLDAYYNALKTHRLVPHELHYVSEFKSGERNRPDFWHAKSKKVFRWGPGEGNASVWVSFVGYELNRDGSVRVRKSKTDDEMRRIARIYYTVIKSQDVGPESLVERFGRASGHWADYELLTSSLSSVNQAKHIDKYLYHKAAQAARKKRIAIVKEELRKSICSYENQLMRIVSE